MCITNLVVDSTIISRQMERILHFGQLLIVLYLLFVCINADPPSTPSDQELDIIIREIFQTADNENQPIKDPTQIPTQTYQPTKSPETYPVTSYPYPPPTPVNPSTGDEQNVSETFIY